MGKIVIIPTYNEKENIAAIIQAVFSNNPDFHVLVIDDGSPDGTLMPDSQGKLFLEERTGKLGLGTAYIHGFKWALSKGYELICEMDADFSHNPADLKRLADACMAGADLAVGSRYVQGGAVKNWPASRIFLSKGASFYTRMILGMPVMDPTAGFVCYRAEVLRKIDLDSIQFIGYAFQIEMKYAAWKLNFRIKEVPITFIDRKHGVSKMNKGIISEGIMGVIRLRSRKY